MAFATFANHGLALFGLFGYCMRIQ